MYDGSTGLIYRGGRYFDPQGIVPMPGIWLALTPLLVVQGWRQRRRGEHPWVPLLCVGLFAGGK